MLTLVFSILATSLAARLLVLELRCAPLAIETEDGLIVLCETESPATSRTAVLSGLYP